MADTVKVHVTLFADPIEVPADEVEVLRAQGLLHEDPQPAPVTAPAPEAPAAPDTPAPAPAAAPAKAAAPKTKEA